MNLIINGIIIGIGKILPGISGSMLAITLGIYEEIISSISNLKNNIAENIKFLSKIGIGIIISIIIFSKIIVKCINNHYFLIMLLFIGMISSGIIEIMKTTKLTKRNIIVSTMIIIIIYNILPKHIQVKNHVMKYTLQELINLTGIGIIDALASIIPGISGTALLMTLGYYKIIITTFSSVTNLKDIKTTLFVLIPFGAGFIIGTIYISKIINTALKKNKTIINTITLIFMIITNILLTTTTFTKKHTLNETIIGMLLFMIGLLIIPYINKLTSKNKKTK